MTTITFSQTSLPPLVRLSNSADAPFAVPSGTEPRPRVTTIQVIGVREAAQETIILREPEVRAVVQRGRRLKKGAGGRKDR